MLLLAAASFAVSGYRRGFVVGVMSLAGFLGGGLLAMLLTPHLLGQTAGSATASLVAIVLVLSMAMAGQVGATLLAGRLRDLLTWHPVRVIDAGVGALTMALSVLIVCWFLGAAVATTDLPPISGQVRDSAVLRSVSRFMPPSAATWFSAFANMLDANGLPPVFNPFTNEPIASVPEPDPQVRNSVAVRKARGTIVTVIGTAQSCSRQIEGTGFVYAQERVMTNAHVVAGVREPRVQVEGKGFGLTGRGVLFDAKRDVAVLYVPGPDARPLPVDGSGKSRDLAVVAGFPRNGPFRVAAA